MEVYMSQTKLTRPPSSLLRSPTFRSSVHSLSTLNETDQSSEEQKPHKPSSKIVQGKHSSPLFIALFLVFSSLFYLYFSEDLPNFISFSFPFILVCSIALISKKLLFQEKNKKIGIGLGFPKGDSVVWTIGDEKTNSNGGEKKSAKEGVEFYSNGDFYEGEFHNGRCNGSGVYNYFVNGKYEGDWIDGKYDGYGIESWARGSRYRGQYRQGLRNGFGVYRFYTGDSYAGEWLNGQSSGVGVQTCSDGSSYIGEFRSGVKHGLGCYHFRNGDKYAGEYFGDKIHGFGVYHFANGHCYEGSWHEGHKQGLGLYIFRNGDTKCGEWDHGVLKTPQSLTTDSVLRVIKASREAAEKATQIPRPDEQVNKAAMAANRAATAARVAAIKAVQNRMNGKLCITNV